MYGYLTAKHLNRFCNEGGYYIMKASSRLTSALLCGTIAACSLSGCIFLPDEETILAAPSVEETNVSYSTITAKRRDLVKQDVNTGTVRSETTYNLSFNEQSGTISKIYVHAGDVVKKGDLICELDTAELDYAAKEVDLRLQRAKLDKQILRERGATQAEIDRAQVEIDLIQIEMDEITKKQESSKLYSAIDGTVSSLGAGVSAGNYIDAGTTVATIIDTESLYVAIKPSADNYTLYDMGTQLSIEVGEESYAAEVFMIPSEMTSQSFEDDEVIYEVYDPDAEDDAPEELVFDIEYVYIRFTETPPKDCVGNLADTVLVIDQRLDAIVISNNLIKKIDDKQIVYLYKDDKKIAQEVEVGLSTGSMSEILSGVEEGDLIIVR